MCEIFGGALSGGFTTHADTLGTTNAIVNCMLSVILDPNAFDAPNAEAEADAFIEWVKASPLAAGTDQIFAPGEPERARRAERSAEGVPVDPATWQQILDAARDAGMPASEVDTWAQKLH
jgi:hydroxycarboxylate dehydrogenase B